MVMEPSALLDFMEPMFPLIGQMVSTPQDAEWHAEGDVRRHTEWVLDTGSGAARHWENPHHARARDGWVK